MKKQLVTALAAAMTVGLAGTAAAEDGGPEITFGASTSFAYDIARPPDQGANPNNTGIGNGSTLNSISYASWEQDRSFNIDLIQLGITGTRGRASYGAKLDFGDLAKLAGDSFDGDIALQEGWIGYDMDFLGLTAGRFGTPIGYEVVEPWGRSNISTSYAWGLQPVNHDGLKLHGSAAGIDMMIGVVNGFTVADDPIEYVANPTGQLPANDTDDEKGVIGSIGGAPFEFLNWYVSGIYTELADTQDTSMVNAIISGAVQPGNYGLTYAIEGQWREDANALVTLGQRDLESWSIAAYLGTNIGATSLDLRFEYVDDGGILTSRQGIGDGGADLWEITATASWALVDGVDFRVEYRHNDANRDIFGDSRNQNTDTQDVIQAQLVWYPEL